MLTTYLAGIVILLLMAIFKYPIWVDIENEEGKITTISPLIFAILWPLMVASILFILIKNLIK